ncbi:unnamed protein product [Plutella xylostella]|uniref:(diamondback moth) hypothetical protein n=1 Tax=Plutella xylostella TaxID=51655 RepID=A0A8S4FVP4_PLUXY|nr:unnamed protein product [Plutella xylostella]
MTQRQRISAQRTTGASQPFIHPNQRQPKGARRLRPQRAVTEQLRREAAIKRIPVSSAVADIVKFITDHEQEDCLLVGFSSQKVNPFREKSSCTVL